MEGHCRVREPKQLEPRWLEPKWLRRCLWCLWCLCCGVFYINGAFGACCSAYGVSDIRGVCGVNGVSGVCCVCGAYGVSRVWRVCSVYGVSAVVDSLEPIRGLCCLKYLCCLHGVFGV